MQINNQNEYNLSEFIINKISCGEYNIFGVNCMKTIEHKFYSELMKLKKICDIPYALSLKIIGLM